MGLYQLFSQETLDQTTRDTGNDMTSVTSELLAYQQLIILD